MTKLYLKNTLRFFTLIAVQLLVFNNLGLFGYINPMVYPLFILLLPFEISGIVVLFLGFTLGLTLDLFTGSVGLHAAATTFLAFMRPVSLRIIASPREFEAGIEPGINDLGYRWFISNTLFLILMHHFFYFTLEAFNFSEVGSILLRTVLTSLVSVTLIVLLDLLFKPSLKRK